MRRSGARKFMRAVLWGRGCARARPASCLGWSIGYAGCRADGIRRRRRPGRPRRPRRRRAEVVRSEVSTRSERPDSGSMSVSSPTSTSSSSRGSTISMATTLWRPATAVNDERQSSGPRKSDTIATRPAVVRDVPTACRARASDAPAGPSSGTSAASAWSSPSMPFRPAAGGKIRSRPAPNVTTPRRSERRDTKRPMTSDAPFGDVRLAAVGRPEVHRGRRVEQEPRGELPVGHVLADLRDEAARRGVPVDPADVVAGFVRADPVEVQPEAEAPSAVVAGHPPADAAGEGDLEAADEIVGDRPGSRASRGPRDAADLGQVGHAVGSTANSRRGDGTSETTLAMTESGVMPSASAA